MDIYKVNQRTVLLKFGLFPLENTPHFFIKKTAASIGTGSYVDSLTIPYKNLTKKAKMRQVFHKLLSGICVVLHSVLIPIFLDEISLRCN